MSDLKKKIGAQIRASRKSQGYTQEQLADLTNVNFSYISDVERGTRNISLISLEKIILALEISPYEIFHFEQFQSQLDASQKKELINSLCTELNKREFHELKFIHIVLSALTQAKISN